MKTRTILIGIACLSLGQTCVASNIAVVDTGVDIVHPMLVDRLWINRNEIPGDRQDNDFNSYVDDIHGWNFVDNNNHVLDYEFIGTFRRELYKFYQVQSKIARGLAASDEDMWAKTQLRQPKFATELARFSTFIHGTHVAGIASLASPNAKLMGVRVLGGAAITIPEQDFVDSAISPFGTLLNFLDIQTPEDAKMREALNKTIDEEIKILRNFSMYLVNTEMQVANCSWGITFQSLRRFIYSLGRKTFQRSLTEFEVSRYVSYFFDRIMSDGSNFIHMAHKTLFTFAAGNDGTNNDIYPMYPANISERNTIVVAATRGYQELANFSNIGAETVDIAAPGVDIDSSIPGSKRMALSGTSMAAPTVANIAGKVFDANSKLAVHQVKEILMRTVDKKDFLKGKVRSSGIVNEQRAVRAAALSLEMSLDQAIRKAINDVADVIPLRIMDQPLSEGFPVPLPSPFRFES